MIRHAERLICTACGIAILSCVVGCAGGSPTAVPTYTAVPTPTRETQDDESWHECVSAVMVVWDEAEAAFLKEQERSLDDLHSDNCDGPLQVMAKYIETKWAMNACPLPTNPEMREVDRLFQESLSDFSQASDYLVLWCASPAGEVEFNRQTMLLHWEKGRAHTHEAMTLYNSLKASPTPDPNLPYLIAVRDTVVPLYDQSQATFEDIMALLNADDSDRSCDLVPEWQSQVQDAYEALLACPEPLDVRLQEAQDLWLNSLAEAAMASNWMLKFCEQGDSEYLDDAWASLDESNRLAEEYWTIWDTYWE